MRKIWMVIRSTMCALALACGSDHENGPDSDMLAGTRWRLTAWSVSALNATGYAITADFGEADMSGRVGVNVYGGPYTVTNAGGFSVGTLHATAMSGSDDAMRAESLYLDLLRQARRYLMTSTTLTLRNAANQDLLIFQVR